MKKQKIFFTLIFSLLLSNVFAQTVYVTKTGKKYHNENCRSLSKSSYPISLSDAKAKGYDACSICKPVSAGKTTTKTDTIQEKKTNTIQTNKKENKIDYTPTWKNQSY